MRTIGSRGQEGKTQDVTKDVVMEVAEMADNEQEGPSAEGLRALEADIRACKRCRLHTTRTQAVPGDGPHDAEIMFVGEAPGFYEDKQGKPFVGAAGHYLNRLLEKNGLRREDVYITNIVKCRPPKNRDPLPDEIEACEPYLDRQIEFIKPRIIVTLGRFAMQHFFPGASISRIHGQPRQQGERIFFPIFHPAAGPYQPKWQPLLEEDFHKLAVLVQRLRRQEMSEGESPSDDEDYEQLTLF